jgi:hypothetical protein
MPLSPIRYLPGRGRTCTSSTSFPPVAASISWPLTLSRREQSSLEIPLPSPWVSLPPPGFSSLSPFPLYSRLLLRRLCSTYKEERER